MNLDNKNDKDCNLQRKTNMSLNKSKGHNQATIELQESKRILREQLQKTIIKISNLNIGVLPKRKRTKRREERGNNENITNSNAEKNRPEITALKVLNNCTCLKKDAMPTITLQNLKSGNKSNTTSKGETNTFTNPNQLNKVTENKTNSDINPKNKTKSKSKAKKRKKKKEETEIFIEILTIKLDPKLLDAYNNNLQTKNAIKPEPSQVKLREGNIKPTIQNITVKDKKNDLLTKATTITKTTPNPSKRNGNKNQNARNTLQTVHEVSAKSGKEIIKPKPKKGVIGLIEIKNPNYVKVKDTVNINKLDVMKAVPILSSREIKQIEIQKLKQPKYHLQSEEAIKDLARLALIRQQRQN